MSASEASPVRIGIAGAGFMGRQHIALVERSPDAVLAAVADPAVSPDAFAVPVFAETKHMLDADAVDAVIIANPNPLHVDTAIACLAAGVAVLVEKPVAVDLAEARALVAAVERSDGRLLVGHHRRHHPSITRARQAISSGLIGDVIAVSGMWSARKEDAYFTATPWHSRPGAGVILINLVHDLELLRYLCGEVVEVQALTSSHNRGLHVEDTVSVNLRFDSGAVGSFLASDAGVSPWGWDQSTEDTDEFPYLPDGTAYQLSGTRGALAVPNLALFTYGPGMPPDWHSPLSRTYLAAPPAVAFEVQLAHFVDVVRRRAEPLVTAEDASRTLTLVDAVTRAARSCATVRVTGSASHRDTVEPTS